MTHRFLELPCAWRGAELFQRSDWDVRLAVAEVDALLRSARAADGVALIDLDCDSFALERLAALRDSLETGSGAARIRGISLDGLDDEQVERLFWGIANQVGTPVSQTATGERLLHVRDEGFEESDPRFRGPHSNKRLRFHTDRCDVIAFLCARSARSGGENELISSVTLHNEMRRRYPDALAVLEQDFIYLRHTIDSANERAFIQQPVFSEHAGFFAASFLRVLIDRADRAPGVPSLSSDQREALDTLERVAEDPELYVRFRLEPGEMLFVNNWVTFHRRREFEDHDDPAHRRHLLRLWLAVSNSRPLDPRFGANFGSTAAGAVRGGIHPGSPL